MPTPFQNFFGYNFTPLAFLEQFLGLQLAGIQLLGSHCDGSQFLGLQLAFALAFALTTFTAFASVVVALFAAAVF